MLNIIIEFDMKYEVCIQLFKKDTKHNITE